MIELTLTQRHQFEVLLDIINSERKAAIFLSLSRDYATINDLVGRLDSEFSKRSGYSGVEKNFDKGDVNGDISRVLGHHPRGLLEKTEVGGLRKNTKTNAWRLTEFGEKIRLLVGYAVPFLPCSYHLSAYEVIGAMNVVGSKRASYTRVNILRHLANGELSLQEISDFVGLNAIETKCKLNDLAGVKNANGENIPFVEPVSVDNDMATGVYRWTGKSIKEGDFHIGSKMFRLARRFADGGIGAAYTTAGLFHGSGYSTIAITGEAITKLEHKGYARYEPATAYKKYRITPAGRDYVQNCIRPLIGMIIGLEQQSAGIIYEPTNLELTHAINVFDRQRGNKPR